MPPRAGNVTLNSRRLAAALGYEPFAPWPLDPARVPTDEDWHQRVPRGLPELQADALYCRGRDAM